MRGSWTGRTIVTAGRAERNGKLYCEVQDQAPSIKSTSKLSSRVIIGEQMLGLVLTAYSLCLIEIRVRLSWVKLINYIFVLLSSTLLHLHGTTGSLVLLQPARSQMLGLNEFALRSSHLEASVIDLGLLN